MGMKRQQQSVIDPSLSIKAVTKGSVWAISENDVIRMWKIDFVHNRLVFIVL